jgi:deoxyhypusine synthase
MDKEKIARENILRNSEEADGKIIKGYDFNKGVDYEKILKSFGTTGYQATNLSKGIKIVDKMIKNNAFIYLGYTSNLVSSGLREIFRYLVQNKKINVVVSSAGGIEEDIIKCLGDFVLGDFSASGKQLREKGINRIGNIYVPNSRYTKFEEFIIPLFEEIYQEQKSTGKIITPSELI